MCSIPQRWNARPTAYQGLLVCAYAKAKRPGQKSYDAWTRLEGVLHASPYCFPKGSCKPAPLTHLKWVLHARRDVVQCHQPLARAAVVVRAVALVERAALNVLACADHPLFAQFACGE